MRIRAATLDHYDKYERTFGLKHYSNILSLPFPCLLAKHMLFDEASLMKSLDRQLLTQKEMIKHPVKISHVERPKQEEFLPFRNLEQLLEEDNKATFRSQFSVQAVVPEDPVSMVRI